MYIYFLFSMYFNHKKSTQEATTTNCDETKKSPYSPPVVSDIHSSTAREQERRRCAWIDYFDIVYRTDECREIKEANVRKTSWHVVTYSYAMTKDVTA